MNKPLIDFFEINSQGEEDVYAANRKIKELLAQKIKHMEAERMNGHLNIKVATEVHEQDQLRREVEELLADEQRDTQMGGWA